MAITEAFSGSETVSTTEWSLTTDTAGPDVQTDDGVYQCFIDCNAIVQADVFQFRVYEKVLAASTQRVVWEAFLPVGGIFATPALVLLHGWEMTIDKISGTDRLIDWSIRKVA